MFCLITLETYDITELGLVMDVLRSDRIQPVLEPRLIKRVTDAYQKLEQERLEKERVKQMNRRQNGVTDNLSDRSSDYSSSESDSSRSSVDIGDHQRLQQHHGESSDKELNLVRQLQQLLVAHLRIRDKERMMALIFQGVTGDILREILTIFYEPLVKVYKAANIAESLMDAKNFIDELIKVVEQADAIDSKSLHLLFCR
jgi:hypothetical protein